MNGGTGYSYNTNGRGLVNEVVKQSIRIGIFHRNYKILCKRTQWTANLWSKMSNTYQMDIGYELERRRNLFLINISHNLFKHFYTPSPFQHSLGPGDILMALLNAMRNNLSSFVGLALVYYPPQLAKPPGVAIMDDSSKPIWKCNNAKRRENIGQ